MEENSTENISSQSPDNPTLCCAQKAGLEKDCTSCTMKDSSCSDVDCNGDCIGGTCRIAANYEPPRSKRTSHNWLEDIPGGFNHFDIVEVTFKNTRKGFYRNTNNLELHIGDLVAVEASPGHDIGKITMTGKLVALQMKKANLRPDTEILRVFRKAKQSDLERFEAARAKENDTMIRSRKIAEDLKLDMKIGDVEYQGDGNKAIFYYIADERVDFRQLIKILADTFKIRIEMKQIGARQEAGRIGGIGPCGRPLCCSSWMNNFISVSTSAARYQDISLNPQKLAGQCAKLKCCLNFEVDAYVEASKSLPPRDVRLYTQDNEYFHFKTDIFKKEITYSTDKNIPANLVTLNPEQVFEIIALNKEGIKPEKLTVETSSHPRHDFGDILGQNNINRFDKVKKKSKNGGNRNRQNSQQDSGKKDRNNNDNRSRRKNDFRQNGRNRDNDGQNRNTITDNSSTSSNNDKN